MHYRFMLSLQHRLSALAALPVILTLSSASVSAQTLQTQTISLSAGWNLIAFQVNPANPAPSAVFGNLGGNFKAAFTYDAATTQWTSFQNSTQPGVDPAANSLPGVGMADIQLGKGYWIWMNNAQSFSLSGTVPALSPPVATSRGWNLIGVPAGGTTLPAGEQANMLAVLTLAGFNYDTILNWETGVVPPGYRKATPGNDDTDDFQAFIPSKGYWVNVADAALLQPKLLSSARADVDAPPSGNYPSYEDLALSGSPTPLDAGAQTRLVFLPGEDVQQIALSNVGGGIMAWRATWTPADAASTDEPWITLSNSPSEATDYIDNPAYAGKPGQVRRISESGRNWQELTGITTLENDIIYLRLDRKNLSAGNYSGVLSLQTTAPRDAAGAELPNGRRDFAVQARVPGLQGDWHGEAIMSSVNGKNNRVPNVDLQVSFFEDPANPGLLRGYIDSTNSLLWPQDVPLIGYVNRNSGNSFTLSGSFVMPPGDQNNPPYDNPAAGNPNTLRDAEDVDWNGNGRMDALNPFPFAIQRTVLLSGSLTRASTPSGYEIRGTYQEVINGMLRQEIRTLGSFEMRRESHLPGISRQVNAFVNETSGGPSSPENGLQPVVVRSVIPSPALSLGGNGATITRTIPFDTDMVLMSLAVTLRLNSTVPQNLRVTLVSPGGQSLVIFDRQAVEPAVLQNVTFPDARATKDDLSLFLRSVSTTKGDWSLIFQNFGSTGNLSEATIRLTGQPVVSASGRVTAGGNGVPAQVSLTGLPFSMVTQADAGGNFTFPRIPALPVNFSANLPGYSPAIELASNLRVPSFPFPAGTQNAEELRLTSLLGDRPLPGVPIPALNVPGFASFGTTGNPLPLSLGVPSGPPRAVVTAEFGAAPLTVTYSAVGTTGAVAWNFSDGSPVSNSSAGEHVYQNPGVYTAVLTHSGGTDSVRIVVMPSPGHPASPPAAAYVFQPYFTGSGALPADLSEPPVASSVVKADLIRPQHAYAASADIDLAPYGASGQPFSSDGFDSGGPGSFTEDSRNRPGTGGFKDEDYNYFTGANVWGVFGPPSPTDYAAAAGYAVDDDIYSRHPKNVNNGGVPTSHYRMLCHVGAAIQNYSLEGQTIKPAGSKIESEESAGGEPFARTMMTGLVPASPSLRKEVLLHPGPLGQLWSPIPPLP